MEPTGQNVALVLISIAISVLTYGNSLIVRELHTKTKRTRLSLWLELLSLPLGFVLIIKEYRTCRTGAIVCFMGTGIVLLAIISLIVLPM